jgi:hypothetical protein
MRSFIACSSVVTLALVSGCETPRGQARDLGGRPALASIQPVMIAPPPGEPAPEIEEDTSAAGLLEKGFSYFRQEQARAAGDAFRAAIDTGHLNDAGRALAYWHIYLAERSSGNMEAGVDALSSFVVVGQDVLDVRGDTKYAVDENGDFVARFDLENRLARARAVLSASWADKVKQFGRSNSHPVPIQDTSEIEYFLEVAPPCDKTVRRRVEKLPTAPGEPTHVTVTCESGPQGAFDYYFLPGRD